jgi:hypothetical protein
MNAISAEYDGTIPIIDSTHPGAPAGCDGKKAEGADHCLGRSRGGLTTKFQVVVDALPIRLAAAPSGRGEPKAAVR